MTLLREIQAQAASAEGDLATVLRKCKILAARLGSEPFAQWITWELNGYPTDVPVPSYRGLSVQCYANFLGVGWRADRQPIAWPLVGEETNPLTRIDFREGVAKASALIKGATIDKPELGFLVQGKMFPDLNCVGAWIEVSGGEFVQLLSAVRNRILDFVLEIEAANPDAGEAPPNTHPVPDQKLQPLVQNFFGSIGNFAQNSQQFSQTATITASDLKRLVTEMNEHLKALNLSAKDNNLVRSQLDTITAQLRDEPNPVIVREAGRTIRNLTEGAISSLIATAAQPTVWSWVQQLLRQF